MSRIKTWSQARTQTALSCCCQQTACTHSKVHSAGSRVTGEAWAETPNCLQVVEELPIWTGCLKAAHTRQGHSSFRKFSSCSSLQLCFDKLKGNQDKLHYNNTTNYLQFWNLLYIFMSHRQFGQYSSCWSMMTKQNLVVLFAVHFAPLLLYWANICDSVFLWRQLENGLLFKMIIKLLTPSPASLLFNT